jgi:hypothetical protein
MSFIIIRAVTAGEEGGAHRSMNAQLPPLIAGWNCSSRNLHPIHERAPMARQLRSGVKPGNASVTEVPRAESGPESVSLIELDQSPGPPSGATDPDGGVGNNPQAA